MKISQHWQRNLKTVVLFNVVVKKIIVKGIEGNVETLRKLILILWRNRGVVKKSTSLNAKQSDIERICDFNLLTWAQGINAIRQRRFFLREKLSLSTFKLVSFSNHRVAT